jgi:hypothetical protein
MVLKVASNGIIHPKPDGGNPELVFKDFENIFAMES